MDEQLDGTHFQAIDSDMFGDEALEGEEPCDTHAAHMLQNQLLWLEREGGNACAHRWATANQSGSNFSGDRAYSSERWLCVGTGIHPVTPTLTELECMVHLHCNTLATSQNIYVGSLLAFGYLKVEIVGFGTSGVVKVEGSALYEGVRVRVPITSPPRGTLYTGLRVWIRTSTLAARTPLGLIARREAKFGRSVLFADEDFIHPHTASWGSISNYTTQRLTFGLPGGAVGPETLVQLPQALVNARYPDIHQRLFNVNEVTSSKGDVNAVAVWPDDYPDLSGINWERDLDVMWGLSSYVQLRHIHVRERHRARTPVPGQLRPNVPVKSVVEQLPPVSLEHVVARPRVHQLFAHGVSETYSDGEVMGRREERAVYLLGDGTHGIPSIEGRDRVLTRSLKLIEPGETVEVWLQCLPYFVADTLVDHLEALREQAHALDWEFVADVRAPADGGAFTTIQSVEAVQTFEHVPTSLAPVWPALIQLYWRYEADATTRRFPTLKEGALYEVDFGLLTLFKLTLKLDAMTLAQRDRPLSLRVAATPVSVPVPVSENASGPEATLARCGLQIFPSVTSYYAP
jgi:hypothetical protein